jgi:hypothetical protein
MKIGLETNLQMATRYCTWYARNKVLGPRMGIETALGVSNSGAMRRWDAEPSHWLHPLPRRRPRTRSPLLAWLRDHHKRSRNYA